MEVLLYTEYRKVLGKIPGCLNLHDRKIDEYFSKNSENELLYLLSLDPAQWKDQDQYRVLGLGHLRYKASEDDIKKAYRRKALIHHPDKRGDLTKTVSLKATHDYFPCIIKAFELLSDLTKRISYDSIDPVFDNAIPENFKPSESQDSKKIFKYFYNTFNPVFTRNARWSTKQPVPVLGDYKASADHVNLFYTFWYNIESWREYSYLDKDDKTKGENRDERRWIEKQNRVERLKLKKDEMARIRKLVDLSYSNDPRIQRIKEEDKEKKIAYKLAKQKALQSRFDSNSNGFYGTLSNDRSDTGSPDQGDGEKEDDANTKLSNDIEEQKREKALLSAEKRRALKKEKKFFSELVYAPKDGDRENRLEKLAAYADLKDRLELMLYLDKLESWLDLDGLCLLNADLNALLVTHSHLQCPSQIESVKPDRREPVNGKIVGGNGLVDHGLKLLARTLKIKFDEMHESLEKEKSQHYTSSSISTNSGAGLNGIKENLWPEMQMRELVRAMELYPVGTNQRWDVISEFITKRFPDKPKSSRDVINKVKELKNKNKSNVAQPQTNDSQNTSSAQSTKPQLSNSKGRPLDISGQENATPQAVNGQKTTAAATTPDGSVKSQVDNSTGWAITEQKLLEKGLKEVPMRDPQRWEKIAQIVDTKTKLECMLRYKELAEIIRSRKLATTTNPSK